MAMAKQTGKSRRKAAGAATGGRWHWPGWRVALRRLAKAAALATAAFVVLCALYSFLNPPYTAYMLAEAIRQGGIKRDWVSLEEMAPDVPRAVVAAEDANFCLHWGFDMAAIRDAIDEGGGRGASTLSQQTVKNVFLWQGRSWPRKALEAAMTPVAELIWTKRRTLEIYLNVAEFGRGVFGIEAAAQHYFGVSARELSGARAALLAAALPDPKERNPARPSGFLRKRARQILSGADTINVDGRADCFQG
jgi:monofunctional biosynthetic peptidoglycan transglycosylase